MQTVSEVKRLIKFEKEKVKTCNFFNKKNQT